MSCTEAGPAESPSARRAARSTPPGAPRPEDPDASRTVVTKAAKGLVTLADPRSRRTASGRVPSFVGLDAASLLIDASRLVMTATLQGPVPKAIEDSGAGLRVTFRVVTPTRGNYSFDAHASEEGWTPTASGGPAGPFPGRLRVEGRRVVLAIERDYVGPPGPLRWLASVAWTRDAPGSTSYAFDSLPERGFARHPGSSG